MTRCQLQGRRLLRIGLAATCAILLVAAAVAQRAGILTGGPIPDRRGFQGVNDPRYQDVIKNGVVTRRVAGQVYVIAGAGGNVEVFAGDDGVLLVDNNFQIFWDQIRDAIHQISDKPIRFVINTHFHGDHNENNENLAKLGATVFAHPNTRIELARPGRGGVSRPLAGLPMVTSSELFSFHFNGEEVVYVPLKKSHSPGDVGVYFKGSDVFAFGDVFTNDYPSMDFQHGGTVENFIDNYNLAAAMATPKTVFVPGHGQLADRGDLMYVRDAISTIHDRFRKMVDDGMTLEQVRQARPTKEWDQRLATEMCCSVNTVQTSTRFYDQMYGEIQAHRQVGSR